MSHCHLDHANGSHQWAEIYCHQFCVDNLVKKQKEGQDRTLINLGADYDLELIQNRAFSALFSLLLNIGIGHPEF